MFKFIVLLVALATVQAHVIAPAYHHHGYAPAIAAAPAHIGYAHAPMITKSVMPAGLLGVAYSAAPVVSHMSYTSGLGYNYGW